MNQINRIIYTIGHSNHSQETFLSLLRANGIEVLIDTRSAPYSKYATQFNAPELKAAVTAAGIRYEFRGQVLGGRPEGSEFYDAAGHVLYDRVSQTEAFQQEIAALEQRADQERVAIFCAEENPSECHRRLLVGRVLNMQAVEVWHIRGDGRLQSEAELQEAEEKARNAGGQQSLFETEEVTEWRSIQSVLRKKPPSSSSSH